jgi:tRNA nucleotidyltransferase (CCA-adding enzyme)
MTHCRQGSQVIAALEAKKAGPWLGQVLNNNLIEWQLEHPEGTLNDCIKWLKEQKGAGRIRVDDKSANHSNKRPKTKQWEI